MLHKKTGGQNQKKNIFCRVLGLALGKEVVCRVPATWHSAKSSRPGGPRACHVAALCRVPNGRHSAKVTAMDAVCPLALFAECPCLLRARHSAKNFFAECLSLPRVRHWANRPLPSAGFSARQSVSLPSARFLPLGKPLRTRQRSSFL